MLDALGAVPVGMTARGWVTAMSYVPSVRGYQRYEHDRAGSARRQRRRAG